MTQEVVTATAESALTFAAAFQYVWGVLTLVMAFLLGRVFSEIDKLRAADQNLADRLNALMPSLIDKVTFQEHLRTEEASMREIRDHLRSVAENLHELSVQVARLDRNRGDQHGQAS